MQADLYSLVHTGQVGAKGFTDCSAPKGPVLTLNRARAYRLRLQLISLALPRPHCYRYQDIAKSIKVIDVKGHL